MFKKLLNKTAFIGLSLLSSSAVFAHQAAPLICNDCGNDALQQLVAEKGQNHSMYLVDFVNATAHKFDAEGNVVPMSLGELNVLNQKYDYRKTTLRAVSH